MPNIHAIADPRTPVIGHTISFPFGDYPGASLSWLNDASKAMEDLKKCFKEKFSIFR